MSTLSSAGNSPPGLKQPGRDFNKATDKHREMCHQRNKVQTSFYSWKWTVEELWALAQLHSSSFCPFDTCDRARKRMHLHTRMLESELSSHCHSNRPCFWGHAAKEGSDTWWARASEKQLCSVLLTHMHAFPVMHDNPCLS